jgi:hypothetical protein
VRSGVLKRADNVKSGRGRPKLTWDESVKRDLKEWNIPKDLAFLSCALFVSLCVSLFSRLFWVSSLAYPNLLGTKGYVVVVVVVV